MTAPLWTARDAMTATGGRLDGPAWTASGISIDSRTVAPGDLFVAIAGPNHDGHDHVGAALAGGAAAAMVHRRPPGLDADAPLLTVTDTVRGLEGLAVAARARTRARIAAVTGSVGKTGTKEMLRLVLAEHGATHATQGNLNNHWGAPLSLARMPTGSAYAVFELGMNHPGEIAPLSRLVRPHVAVITAIEAVHIEFFASTADIADAKAEIFLGVEPGGIAILPADSPHFERLAGAARAAGIETILGFGTGTDADARLIACEIEPDRTHARAEISGRSIDFHVGMAGRHWANNALAVLLAAQALGIEPGRAAPALAAMRPPAGRGSRHVLAWGAGEITVIDESYNASPASMRAALATLAAFRPSKGGRRVAVLGDMLELGAQGPDAHAALATTAIEAGIDLVFTAGPLMAGLREALPAGRSGGHGADADALAPLVVAGVEPGDVVMVKGSAGSRMSRVVAALRQKSGSAKDVGDNAL